MYNLFIIMRIKQQEGVWWGFCEDFTIIHFNHKTQHNVI